VAVLGLLGCVALAVALPLAVVVTGAVVLAIGVVVRLVSLAALRRRDAS
jgi:hypothetical protein